MRNFAKLVLFFSLSFIGILLLAVFLYVLQDWTGAAILFPPKPAASADMVSYMIRALPAAFYLSILLGLSYSVRRRMAYPVVFTVVLVLALGISAAAFFGLESLSRIGVPVTLPQSANLAKPGFILLSRGPFQTENTQAVFLDDPYKNGSARAVSVQGQSLYYQSQGVSLPSEPLFLAEGKNRLLAGISTDFEQSARVFSAWFDAGLLPYLVYTGSLAVLLLSLGCLVNISFWALANFFFSALAFRGALALEALLNQTNIHELLASFTGGIIPESLINPLIFSTLGVLILLYSALVYLARGRTDG